MHRALALNENEKSNLAVSCETWTISGRSTDGAHGLHFLRTWHKLPPPDNKVASLARHAQEPFSDASAWQPGNPIKLKRAEVVSCPALCSASDCVGFWSSPSESPTGHPPTAQHCINAGPTSGQRRRRWPSVHTVLNREDTSDSWEQLTVRPRRRTSDPAIAHIPPPLHTLSTRSIIALHFRAKLWACPREALPSHAAHPLPVRRNAGMLTCAQIVRYH